MQLMQFASKSIDGLIYHSSWQKEYYQKYYPWIVDKSFFIPFGIDPSILERTPHIDYKGFEVDKPYMLCVGKSRCDWDTVVEAYEEIDTSVRLCLLGGIDEKFRQKKNVIMLPYVSFGEMLVLICHASFCILPIENVKFSFGQIRLLQQMAMGKCVIIPEAISLIDYGIDGKTALFYKPADMVTCRNAIQKALDDGTVAGDIGARAREEVYDNFTEEKMALQIEEVIEKLMLQ